MVLKISLAVSTVLLVVVTFVGVQQYKMSDNISRLTMRVAELEVQNVTFSRQLSGMPVSDEEEEALPRERKQFRRDAETADKPIASDDSVERRLPDVADIKSDLRQELAKMVEEENGSAHEKRQEERESRMMNLMALSIADFAEDQGLDEVQVDELERLMEDSMTSRRELRQELESENISFYEFRQEQRKQREAMEQKLSGMLDEKQIEAFRDAFPFGRRGPR